MPKFAVVFDSQVKDVRDYETKPECKVVDGLPTLRPFIEKTPNDSQVKGGYIVFDDRVERELLQKPTETINAERRAAIKKRLTEIDADSVRALRVVARGRDAQADRDKLDALENEATTLRQELAGL